MATSIARAWWSTFRWPPSIQRWLSMLCLQAGLHATASIQSHRIACGRGQAQTCKYVALFPNKTQRFRVDEDETMFHNYPAADCVDSKAESKEAGFSGEHKMRPKRKYCLPAISYAEDEVLAARDEKYQLGSEELLPAAADIVGEAEMKVGDDVLDEQTLTFIASTAIELDCGRTYAFTQPDTTRVCESAEILPAAGTSLKTAIVIFD